MTRATCSTGVFKLPSVQDLANALQDWIREKGLFWASSITAHLLVLSIGVLIAGAIYVAPQMDGAAPAFESPTVDTSIPDLENFDVGRTSIEPPDAKIDLTSPDIPAARDVIVASAGGSFGEGEITDIGSSAGPESMLNEYNKSVLGSRNPQGVGNPHGSVNGTNRSPYRGRDLGHGTGGPTPASVKAVKAALNWFARHQNPDGSWGLETYAAQCKDRSCSGTGSARSDAAATALSLLPFLGAGQTHATKGIYQRNVQAGISWLQYHQKNDGDLSASGEHQMYSHALATIAMCEAFGLTPRDKNSGRSAQQAIHFIELSQNKQTGGWRYKPQDPGDTSVVGWMVMALKSGQMAGLSVSTETLEGAKRWLKSTGNGNGQFSYEVGREASESMSAVGCLCSQYLGAERKDPVVAGGMVFLMGHTPEAAQRNTYYWYYATQVMHNLPGAEWDTWNRKMRRILIESQASKGCAAGSWDPDAPAKDPWGAAGGRILMTSLSCLTLEVYYRYLPLYQLDGQRADF